MIFFSLKKFEFSKLFYSILEPFLRDEILEKIQKKSWPKNDFFQNVWIFKVVLLYFRTIPEGWNLGNFFITKNDFFKKFGFSKLFYSILGSFLRDEILEKSIIFRDQKNIFFKKFEFSKLFYSILGQFLSDEIMGKSTTKLANIFLVLLVDLLSAWK